MVLRTYIDDSADEKRQDVVVAGAFTGKFGQWSKLKLKWNRALTREGISYFRSTEYYSLHGQFVKYRDASKYPKPKGSEAAARFRDDLERIVRSSGIVGRAVCIPMKLWNKMLSSDPFAPQIFTEPFEIAVQILLAEISKDATKLIGAGHLLTFVADESNAAQRIERVYLEFKRINPNLKNLQGFTHMDDKVTPPLQVADMMASVAKQTFMERLQSGAEVIPKRLGDKIMAIQYLKEDYLTELLEKEKRRRGLV